MNGSLRPATKAAKSPSPARYAPKLTLTRKRPRTVPCGHRNRLLSGSVHDNVLNPGPGHHEPSHSYSKKNIEATAASFAQYSGREEPSAGQDNPSPNKYDVTEPSKASSEAPSMHSAPWGRSRSARLPYQLVGGTYHSTVPETRFTSARVPNIGPIKRHHGQALFAMQCRGAADPWDAHVSPGPAAYIPSLRAVKPHVRGGGFVSQSVRMPTKGIAHSDVCLGIPSSFKSISRTSSRSS